MGTQIDSCQKLQKQKKCRKKTVLFWNTALIKKADFKSQWIIKLQWLARLSWPDK